MEFFRFDSRPERAPGMRCLLKIQTLALLARLAHSYSSAEDHDGSQSGTYDPGVSDFRDR